MGTCIVGKLAKPHGAVVGLGSQVKAKSSSSGLDSAIGNALRASFQPVVDEPIPERLRTMIEMLRIEEQQRKG